MPDLPLFIAIGIGVGLLVVLLRHEHHVLQRDYRPGLDVQNHEGDE